MCIKNDNFTFDRTWIQLAFTDTRQEIAGNFKFLSRGYFKPKLRRQLQNVHIKNNVFTRVSTDLHLTARELSLDFSHSLHVDIWKSDR
jgi:hypothetical protein